MDITNYLNNTIKFLPFIIVFCFVLYSIFATDVKSIIFLTGLLITTFITKIMLPFEGKSKQRKSSGGTGNGDVVKEIRKGNYNNSKGEESSSVFENITSTLQANPTIATVFSFIHGHEENNKLGGKKVVGGDGGQNCELLFLDSDEDGGGKPISQIPLCLVTMWFLLSYILTIIATENIWSENVGLIILLILISLGYTSWFRYFSDCTVNFFVDDKVNYAIVIIAPIIIGVLGGVLWALYISAMNISELKYFVGITPDERCSRPRRALYKCEFK